jgi:hypothetical protein
MLMSLVNWLSLTYFTLIFLNQTQIWTILVLLPNQIEESGFEVLFRKDGSVDVSKELVTHF